jgi:dihydroxyacetone kinase/dihydroxyacetone kinase-like protein
LAAVGAGLTCLVTVNQLTAGEDFGEAAMVVSSLGDPGPDGEATVLIANHSQAPAPGEEITLADLDGLLAGAQTAPGTEGMPMSAADFADVETVVKTIATVAVDNEKYFGDLDAVVGDGDFGYSMARGFELVLSGWDDFDRTDIGTFLKKVAIVITSRIGGTSGPIWGTAFLRAGGTAGAVSTLDGDQVVAMLRASIAGIKARGKSDLGDKTLLDALEPAVVRPGRRRDGDGRRHPRRARAQPREAGQRQRDRRRAARGGGDRSAVQFRRRRGADDQRPRRHPDQRALPALRVRPRAAGPARHQRQAELRRRVLHVA